MTIKEAILKTLEELKTPTLTADIYNYIVKCNYYSWNNAKTPIHTIHAQLGDFIRKNDGRVSRIKNGKNKYTYYLTKYSNDIDIANTEKEVKTSIKKQKYQERDLHKLLASYLNATKNIDSKTIYHESSKNNKDKSQEMVHPDMIGVSFNPLKTSVAKEITNFTTQNNFDLYSYELKREINNDYELKEAYFQALSNSNWANYGYLVTFEISDNLSLEVKRLSDAFGIGVIVLNSYPYSSQILHTAKYTELDVATIDKIANINDDYFKFIELVQKVNKDNTIKKLLEDFCDTIFQNDQEIEKYCQEKHIPQETFEDE